MRSVTDYIHRTLEKEKHLSIRAAGTATSPTATGVHGVVDTHQQLMDRTRTELFDAMLALEQRATAANSIATTANHQPHVINALAGGTHLRLSPRLITDVVHEASLSTSLVANNNMSTSAVRRPALQRSASTAHPTASMPSGAGGVGSSQSAKHIGSAQDGGHLGPLNPDSITRLQRKLGMVDALFDAFVVQPRSTGHSANSSVNSVYGGGSEAANGAFTSAASVCKRKK